MALSSVIVVRVLGNVRGLQRTLARAQRSLGGLTKISQGITGAMLTATKAALLFGAATVAAGALGAASIAGIGIAAAAAAAIAASALAAIPAVMIGIGIAAAAQSQRVRTAFTGLRDHVVGVMRDIAGPLEPVLVRGAERLREAFDALVPSLRRIFAAAAPVLNGLFGRLPGIAARLGPLLEQVFAAGVPVMLSFVDALTRIGFGFGRMLVAVGKTTGLADGVRSVGDAIGSMFEAVGRNAPAIGKAFTRAVPTLKAFGTAIASIGRGFMAMFNQITGSGSQFPAFVAQLGATIGAMLPQLGKLLTTLVPIGTNILSALIPAFTTLVSIITGTLVPAVVSITNFLTQHETATRRVIVGLVALVLAIKTVTIVMSLAYAVAAAFATIAMVVRAAIIVWKNAQLALNLAMMLNPIGLVIAAIVALVAVFVIAYKRSETFRNVVNAAWNGIKAATVAVWNFLKGLTLSTWNAIRSAASSAVNGLRSAVTGAVSAVRSAVTSAWNAVRSGTQAAWNGVKTAVSTAINAVMALVSGIKGRVTGAFSGAAGWLLSAGRSIIQGLLDGITGMIGAVQDKLSTLTNLIPDWKGPAAKDRRLLRPTGQMIMRGLIRGFDDGREGIRRTLGSITTLIEKTMSKRFKKDKIAKLASRTAIRSLGDETKALMRNARLRERTYKRLASAEKVLADKRKQLADYAASVQTGVVSYGSVTGLNAAFNADAMLEQLRARLAKAQQYTALVQKLIKQGLNKTMVDQLAQAGVEGGLATATAIAQGGPKAIREFNRLQGQLSSVGKALGTATARDMYQAGVRASQGLVNGLRRKSRDLTRAARGLARELVKAVKQALGIKSPSRVFRDLGKQTVLGLNIGLDDTYTRRAGARLAHSLTDAFGRPTLDAGLAAAAPGGAGAGGRDIRIHLTADQVSQIERGRRYTVDVAAYQKAGGVKPR